jgi:acid stress-induced BolA-like protein IbaG/YrbA
MDAERVEALLREQLPECEIAVSGEGSHYNITVIGEVFEGKRPVAKQQLVYAALGEQIANGSIHAVNIRTYTPSQWQEQGGA